MNVPQQNEKLLDIKNLKTYFYVPEGVVKAVDDVSFYIKKGEVISLVGESGCGKSVTASSILGLIPDPPGRIESGCILFKGDDLRLKSSQKLRDYRGKTISMIFQEPMTSLNPVFTIGRQISEMYIEHFSLSKKEARKKSIDMLRKVQIPSPKRRINEYPHQLSGGMRQRAMIAMALACEPELILADEPTTALDVTIQAQIMELMSGLQSSFHTSIILITHDLGLVSEFAERVIIMYAGKIVEEAQVYDIFKNPLHPYTVGLLNSIPKLGAKSKYGKKRLVEIKGSVPSLYDLPQGCLFHPRCPRTIKKCFEAVPQYVAVESGHNVACWHYQGDRE